MVNEAEAREQYAVALKAGKKQYKEDVHNGRYPYLQVLDEILDGSMIAGQMVLGLQEIPSRMIVGTKTAGRTSAFASNFMPLLSDSTEFGTKWRALCAAHLSDEGIRDPVKCYEYMGRFYVQEGNKRVSVFKSYDSPTISAYVTRLIPAYSDDAEIKNYYEFLESYPLAGLYQLRFTQPGSFPKLQTALGYDVDHKWTAEEKRIFVSGFYNFETAFNKIRNPNVSVSAADALLVWLKVYPFEDLRFKSPSDIAAVLQTMWEDIAVIAKPEPIAVSTEPSRTEPNFIDKLKSTVFSPKAKLKIAFIHELTPKKSNWIKAHEIGRKRMESALGTQVETSVYMDVGTGERADFAIEDAIKNGAQVIFTTTPPLIGACRKAAVQHHGIKILNCSVSMPYTGVRTYYSRIYEGKFISGAIAGALSKSDHIGYIASYPIFGVPAGINAFALGAQLTNPRARVHLRWSCVPGEPLKELKDLGLGIEVVSTLDIPVLDWEWGHWGTFKIKPDDSTEILCSPYWNWGNFYIKLVRSILDGSWETLDSNPEGKKAINYWWGLASGVIGVKRTDAIPAGVNALADIIAGSIINDSITPFHRPILSQDGIVRNNGSKYFTHEEILNMDWLCDNVDGGIPEFDSLTPKGQAIVRLQGIYRDRIPPEIEGVIL